jgi:hypothetical protein
MSTDRSSIKVFLSHRYRSPATNVRFFDLIVKLANIQFEIDVGASSTSTTRLERMIRDTDAFLGIHSLSDDAAYRANREELRRASRYFRLELDMAVRAGRPAFVFVDDRLAGQFPSHRGVASFEYSAREILSSDPKRVGKQVQRQLEYFIDAIRVAAEASTLPSDRRSVGVLTASTSGRRMDIGRTISDVVESAGRTPITLRWPPSFDGPFIAQLAYCDWVVIDMADWQSVAAVAFLRGLGVPVLRLRRNTESASDEDATLYGELASHYTKDTILWTNSPALKRDLSARVQQIYAEPRLIDTQDDARAYFESAAKLKSTVFMSYARGDRTYAQHVADLLLQHFESVFYYGEPEALPHGGPWRDGLYETLAQAGVGVPILSTNYDNSNYCQEEARFMADLVTNKKMAAFPILLGDCTTKTFSQLQYRRTDRMSPKDIVDGIVKEVRERKL